MSLVLVEHCCTLSLCHLGSEMIITDIQISIQRSSSGLITTKQANLRNSKAGDPFAHASKTEGEKKITIKIWFVFGFYYFFYFYILGLKISGWQTNNAVLGVEIGWLQNWSASATTLAISREWDWLCIFVFLYLCFICIFSWDLLTPKLSSSNRALHRPRVRLTLELAKNAN